MRHAPRGWKVGIGRAAAGMVLAGVFGSSCQPGELPCDKNAEWRALCDEANGGSGGTGGMGGNTGTANAMTVVADCTRWPTLGDMDKFFNNRCAAGTSCHVTASAPLWTDMQTPEVWRRLRDKSPVTSCKSAKLIDPADWRNSVIWAKVQAGTTTCPPGATSAAGIAMPPQMGFEPKLEPVSAEELKCLEGFLRAAGPGM
jgi:hypothetical protein